MPSIRVYSIYSNSHRLHEHAVPTVSSLDFPLLLPSLFCYRSCRKLTNWNQDVLPLLVEISQVDYRLSMTENIDKSKETHSCMLDSSLTQETSSYDSNEHVWWMYALFNMVLWSRQLSNFKFRGELSSLQQLLGVYSLVPRPHPAFQCCTLKSGRGPGMRHHTKYVTRRIEVEAT